jgi:hypothetical protein
MASQRCQSADSRGRLNAPSIRETAANGPKTYPAHRTNRRQARILECRRRSGSAGGGARAVGGHARPAVAADCTGSHASAALAEREEFSGAFGNPRSTSARRAAHPEEKRPPALGLWLWCGISGRVHHEAPRCSRRVREGLTRRRGTSPPRSRRSGCAAPRDRQCRLFAQIFRSGSRACRQSGYVGAHLPESRRRR